MSTSQITLRLRIERNGEVLQLIHEDTDKVLCSGSSDDLVRWIEGDSTGRKAVTGLRAAIEAAA